MSNIDIKDAVITQLGVEATIRFYQAMAAHQLSCSGVQAVVADLIDPILNLVINANLSENQIPEKIEAVFEFYRRYQAEWFWQVGPLSTPPTLSQHLIQHGLFLLEDCPALYFDLTQTLPLLPPCNLIIREASPENALLEWVRPVREAFPSSDNAEGFRKLNASLPHGPGAAFRHYVGYRQDHPVCAGTLFIAEDACMIHNIATRPNCRKRGYGSAMTLHVMQVAKAQGIVHCYLDASPTGMRVYKKMGFKVYAYNQLYGAK